ncbi:hypothetical protein Pint_04206 [Pistacia integerrima]|uniref:Uncharacterized protein n=1 Tax=Pistacia integerrima TaxID=434235 RepID=A0ACC0Z7J2_9ROSI|nr:hypothetical protein Pint_04206 [Pistacia integerrima]
MKTTRFIKPPGFSLYYLNLIDISVGNCQLRLPRNTFQLRKDGGGFFIDLGCEMNYIDDATVGLGRFTTYRIVMGAF